jgi:hypothetical protein
MARTKAVLGSGARLSDYLSASLFARVVPPEVVHAVLNEHGCNTQRVRSFPAVAGIYYCITLKRPTRKCSPWWRRVWPGPAVRRSRHW